jgi:hypothetical protein
LGQYWNRLWFLLEYLDIGLIWIAFRFVRHFSHSTSLSHLSYILLIFPLCEFHRLRACIPKKWGLM